MAELAGFYTGDNARWRWRRGTMRGSAKGAVANRRSRPRGTIPADDPPPVHGAVGPVAAAERGDAVPVAAGLPRPRRLPVVRVGARVSPHGRHRDGPGRNPIPSRCPAATRFAGAANTVRRSVFSDAEFRRRGGTLVGQPRAEAGAMAPIPVSVGIQWFIRRD